MKGQARFVEYILVVLFGSLVVVSISTLIYVFYISTLRNEIRENLNQLTLQVSNEIGKAYEIAKSSKAQPSNYTSILLGKVELNLPASVSRRNYEIILVNVNPVWISITNVTINNQNISFIEKTSGAKVIAKTTQDPIVTVEQGIPNIDVGVYGKSENGNDDRLSYYRYNINGTIYDGIVLGKSDILVGISSIS